MVVSAFFGSIVVVVVVVVVGNVAWLGRRLGIWAFYQLDTISQGGFGNGFSEYKVDHFLPSGTPQFSTHDASGSRKVVAIATGLAIPSKGVLSGGRNGRHDSSCFVCGFKVAADRRESIVSSATLIQSRLCFLSTLFLYHFWIDAPIFIAPRLIRWFGFSLLCCFRCCSSARFPPPSRVSNPK